MHPQTEHKPLTRRRFGAFAVLAVAGGLGTAAAQEPMPLTLSEAIPIPGGSLSVLSLQVRGGESTQVNLRMRALAEPKSSIDVDPNNFRLLAAGVPRAPASASYIRVAPDSATDFDLSFSIPDRTDDLVLQLRFGDVVVKRRLPKR